MVALLLRRLGQEAQPPADARLKRLHRRRDAPVYAALGVLEVLGGPVAAAPEGLHVNARAALDLPDRLGDAAPQVLERRARGPETLLGVGAGRLHRLVREHLRHPRDQPIGVREALLRLHAADHEGRQVVRLVADQQAAGHEGVHLGAADGDCIPGLERHEVARADPAHVMAPAARALVRAHRRHLKHRLHLHRLAVHVHPVGHVGQHVLIALLVAGAAQEVEVEAVTRRRLFQAPAQAPAGSDHHALAAPRVLERLLIVGLHGDGALGARAVHGQAVGGIEREADELGGLRAGRPDEAAGDGLGEDGDGQGDDCEREDGAHGGYPLPKGLRPKPTTRLLRPPAERDLPARAAPYSYGTCSVCPLCDDRSAASNTPMTRRPNSPVTGTGAPRSR